MIGDIEGRENDVRHYTGGTNNRWATQKEKERKKSASHARERVRMLEREHECSNARERAMREGEQCDSNSLEGHTFLCFAS